MVHFLVYGDGGRYQEPFERYLRLLNGGVASEEAFVRVFGPDIDAFEERWTVFATAARPSAFVTALERIEFLAEGALELSRRGESPDSLDGLRERLDAIGFTLQVEKHGRIIELGASDGRNFEIPADDLVDRAPRFVTKPRRAGRTSRRLRMLEDEHPTPPEIATKDLEPHDLAVRWRRDRKSGALRYEIEVR